MPVNRSVPDVVQKRKDWNGLISGFKASDLVFLDESGCNMDMTRRSPGCGSQRLLRCRLHPAGRGPNSSSLFPPQAAVVAGARKGLLAPFRPRRGSRNGKKLAASLNAFFSFLRFTASPKILCLRKAKTESECEKELCGHQKERKIIKNQFKKPR